MNSLSKKYKKEWQFFINPKTQKVQFNKLCSECKNDCKQSFKVQVVYCKHYEKKLPMEENK